jgi:hypothetical protein
MSPSKRDSSPDAQIAFSVGVPALAQSKLAPCGFTGWDVAALDMDSTASTRTALLDRFILDSLNVVRR